MKYPQSENVQNQRCSGKPYPHQEIKPYQPKQVGSSHQESSDDQISREELNIAINL